MGAMPTERLRWSRGSNGPREYVSPTVKAKLWVVRIWYKAGDAGELVCSDSRPMQRRWADHRIDAYNKPWQLHEAVQVVPVDYPAHCRRVIVPLEAPELVTEQTEVAHAA